ncbi:MAG: class I SAM-dependent methyltransferase [Rhodospirillaceae bacterium]|nr:class I SAM-dependent methyltransferase [Rhodospirillaceae bacterium]
MKNRQNADVLPSLIELKGKKVADVGCGDGSMTRLMTRQGAKVFGVECNSQMLERARAAKPAGDEIYYQGVAENLPFEDGRLDVVVFFNSLHHVAPAHQGVALDQAARVLKPGGIAYVCEPVAEGAHFELMQPVHDETDVRAAAHKHIRNAEDNGLTEEKEITYIHPATYENFKAFADRMVAINPGLEDRLDAVRAELEQAFSTLGRKGPKGYEFDQPMRVNLLRKPAK